MITKHRYTVYDSGFTYSVALDIPGAGRVMLVSSEAPDAKAKCQAFADELNARMEEVCQ